MGLHGPQKASIWVRWGYAGQMPRLTESRARRLPLSPSDAEDLFTFCSEVKGLGVRCSPNVRSYFVQLVWNGSKRRITLGPVGTLPFEGPAHAPGARDLAIAALTAARRGEDPYLAIGQRKQPAGLTVAQLWAAYQQAGYPRLRGTGHKRPSTIKNDASRYDLYIAPRLGSKAVAEIDTAAVRRWLDRIKARGQRSQCLILLKSLLTFAHTRGLAATNPVDIRADKSRQVQTFLTPEQLQALDAACVELITEQPTRMPGFVALRVLIATGCRTSEILSAQRRYFNPAQATLWLPIDKNSENGREVLLSPTAVAALASLPATSSPYLFLSRAVVGHMTTLQKHADDAFARAGLERVRIHDLRHSFASTAVGDGVSLFTTGELLGHRDMASTKRYAHLARDRKRAALDRVSAALNGKAS
jgi:integrase